MNDVVVSILKFTDLTLFPENGREDVFYFDDTTKKQYYWDGSSYVEMFVSGGGISLTPFKQNTTSALTGTTSETLITSILIPANTFQSNDWLRWIMSINATGNANSKILKFYFNTSAAVGGVQVAQRTLPNAVTQVVIRNMFFVNSLSSQKTIVGVTLNAASDEATTGTQATLSIDFSIDQYFIVSGTLAVGTDTITINGISSKISR